MAVTMHEYYLTQYDYMKKVLDAKEELFGKFPAFYKKVNPDRVYLIGSGTSNNGGQAAAEYMSRQLGVEVTASAPSNMGKVYGARPLVILTSQGGRSTNTVAAIEALKKEGVPVVTLTDPIDTPVGNAGDLSILLAMEDEKAGPKTRGYMGTVLSLYLLSLMAGLEMGTIDKAWFDARVADLEKTASMGQEYLAAAQKFYDAHAANISEAKFYVFAGKGLPAKVGQEDALKVLETICAPSFAYEFEEFLHGPALSTSPDMAIFFFMTEGVDGERMSTLAEKMRGATKNVYVISHGEAGTPADNTLVLPCPDPYFMAPFVDILFGQLISALMPTQFGYVRHPAIRDIFMSMNTKVR